jgi:sulfatase modifying factor 1
MRKSAILAAVMWVVASMATGSMAVAGAAARAVHGGLIDGFVLVQGGVFKNTKSNYYGKEVTVTDFYIGKYDVTQKEWTAVMGSNPSRFKGDNLPVEMVSWYDSVEYCNKRSLKEGLQPYYNIDKNGRDPYNQPDPKFGALDTVRWTVTINAKANGYRLPSEAEWEYAAGGGQRSRSYTYSGSDAVDAVAWYWRNSGDKVLTGAWNWSALELNHNRTQPVGAKMPNELGLYDMSGNVRQWCWDWHGVLATRSVDPKGSRAGFARVWRGGGWIGADFCCATAYRGYLAANGTGPDQGLRVSRNG